MNIKIILTVVLFIMINYFFINDSTDWEGIKSNKMTLLDCAYFTTVTFSTVGYGDITPKSKRAKLFTMGIIYSLILNIYFL